MVFQKKKKQRLILSYKLFTLGYIFILLKPLVYPTQTLNLSYTAPLFILHKPLGYPTQTLSLSYTNPKFILHKPLVYPIHTLSLSYTNS